MKVLFDTNVYVSESLVGGLASEIVTATLEARFRVFVSSYILDELRRVLVDKLSQSPRLAALARQRTRGRAESIEAPESRHDVIADPADSPILKAAIAAGVDYLVTDDRHLLDLNPYEGIRIVSMRDFAGYLRDEGLVR